MIWQDNARNDLWNDSATKLKQWLVKTDTREEIAYLITSYFCGRGDISVKSIMPEVEFLTLTQTMDDVGLFNFMEEKMPIEMIRLQEEHYK